MWVHAQFHNLLTTAAGTIHISSDNCLKTSLSSLMSLLQIACLIVTANTLTCMVQVKAQLRKARRFLCLLLSQHIWSQQLWRNFACRICCKRSETFIYMQHCPLLLYEFSIIFRNIVSTLVSKCNKNIYDWLCEMYTVYMLLLLCTCLVWVCTHMLYVYTCAYYVHSGHRIVPCGVLSVEPLPSDNLKNSFHDLALPLTTGGNQSWRRWWKVRTRGGSQTSGTFPLCLFMERHEELEIRWGLSGAWGSRGSVYVYHTIT